MDKKNSGESTTKNFFDVIKLAANERLGVPLVRSFAVAWCIANFRIILILLGGQNTQEKIAAIEACMADPNHGGWLFLWGYPLLSAVLYVTFSRSARILSSAAEALWKKAEDRVVLFMQGRPLIPADQAQQLRENYQRAIDDANQRAESERLLALNLERDKNQLLQWTCDCTTRYIPEILESKINSIKDCGPIIATGITPTPYDGEATPQKNFLAQKGIPELWVKFIKANQSKGAQSLNELIDTIGTDRQFAMDAMLYLDLLKIEIDAGQIKYRVNGSAAYGITAAHEKLGNKA